MTKKNKQHATAQEHQQQKQLAQHAAGAMKHRNIWKIISCAFISLFCIFLVLAVLRAYHFKTAFTTATPEQLHTAQDILANDLKHAGDDINTYEVHISNHARTIQRKGTTKHLIQALLKKAAVSHAYLIDLDTQKIVMHSTTETYDWMAENNLEHPDNLPHAWHIPFPFFRGKRA